MRAVVAWAALAMLLGARPGSAQLAGACFDLEGVGAWRALPETMIDERHRTPPPDQSGDSVNMTPPTRIRLADAPGRGGRSLVEIPEGALQTPHFFRSWRAMGDRLELVFTSGYTGVEGSFAREGEDWRGALRTMSDEGGTLLYERDHVLTRVDCDSRPPIPDSVDPPVLRRVELVSGAVLELGRPLPAGVALEPRRTGAWTVLDQATGRFARADTIVVVRIPPDGPVGWIELRSIDGFDTVAFETSMRQEFGPPRARFGGGSEWRNRTTRVFASASWRVVLTDPRFMP